MAIILEDSQKVTKKQIPIPQNAKKVFKAMKKIYEPYLDKNIPGSKILKSLGSDKKYNKHGINAHENGNEVKQDSVNVNDAKVRLHRMNKLPKNSIQYQLNGGELAANIYKKGIERARANKEVEKVKPPKPTSNAALKPSEISLDTIKTPSGKITYKSVSESRRLNEDYDDYLPIYEYLADYSPSYVFSSFLENPKGKQSWGVLINPSMYAKALKEFTKYGKLINFPTKYIYQWMGIIMKNTAILMANTDIAGHSRFFPYDEFEDFITSYLGERNVEFNRDEIKIVISEDEAFSICEGNNPLIIETVVDKYGQTYLPWVTQDEADRIAARRDVERKIEKYEEIVKDIEDFNQSNYDKRIEIDYNNGNIYFVTSIFCFLGDIGFYDWMQMPDGSDAFSDFGIEPLQKILEEYNEDLSPEKVLVLVNRALDVFHQRGDMASIFIDGGSKALSRIAEHKSRNNKKVYITERQIQKLSYGEYTRKHSK